MARFKPKQFARVGLVRPTVDALCHMCAEPNPPGHDDDDDALPPAKIASQVHCSRLNGPSVRLRTKYAAGNKCVAFEKVLAGTGRCFGSTSAASRHTVGA